MPNRRDGREGGGGRWNKWGWGWNKWGNWKILQTFNSRVGVDEILFDTLKVSTKKLKCFGLLSLLKSNTFLNQMHSFRH